MAWRNVVHQLLRALRLVSQSDVEIQWTDTQPKPQSITKGTLSIITNAEQNPKWACFHCPGCGELFYRLPLTPASKAGWSLSMDWLGRPSLSPSIRQKSECKAHFWIRKGRVQWCADSQCRPVDSACSAKNVLGSV